jgi:hypothetical protein
MQLVYDMHETLSSRMKQSKHEGKTGTIDKSGERGHTRKAEGFYFRREQDG